MAATGKTSVLGILRLIRASIALSPLADGVASLAIARAAGAEAGSSAAIALAVSFCAYAFGMALNDVADRAKDARSRPERPIPSGAVGIGAARAVVGIAAVGALLLGACLPVGAFVLTCTLLATIAAYDLVPGHGDEVGPVLLGAARAQNLALCATALGAGLDALPYALVYAVYIGAVSVAARMEDDPNGARVPRLVLALRVAMIAAVVGPAVPVLLANRFVPGISPGVAIGAVLAVRLALAQHRLLRERPPDGAAIARCVGVGLSGIFLFDAALAATSRRPVEAALLVLGFFLSRALARRFPPS